MISDIISSFIRSDSSAPLEAAAIQAKQQKANARLWAGHEMVEHIRQKERVNELEYWKQAWGEESRSLAKSVGNA